MTMARYELSQGVATVDRGGPKPGEGSGRAFRIVLPRRSSMLEFWHTGTGKQLVNEAIPGVGGENARRIEAEGEREALFYSAHPDDCMLFSFSAAGKLSIEKGIRARDPLPGEPSWEMDESGKVTELFWEFLWESTEGDEPDLEIVQGIAQVAARFVGRFKLDAPDLSADFGSFISQVFLGWLPLNLTLVEGFLAPRCNVLTGQVEAYGDLWSRDATWAYAFLANVDPAGATRLISDYIALSAKHAQDSRAGMSPVVGHIGGAPSNWGIEDYWDDAAAELLMLAGLHHRISGDLAFARAHAGLCHRCAEHLLSLIREGEDLPITSSTWDGQGALIGAEPYFTALCFAGLNQLAAVDRALGSESLAARWEGAARRMRSAALEDYRKGGLWNSDRGTFINFIDYKDPGLASPRSHNWSRSAPQARGVPRAEFALYETVVPIWLGLQDDEGKIRNAYRWIDQNYDYASGRGGISFPPHVGQTFVALLDACVRQKYGIGGADRLLQAVLDRAFDGGIPMTEAAFGAYRGGGPAHPGWKFQFFPQTHSGRTWDNSPYFGLVMSLHYGLQYSSEGWELRDPKPIANYGLTAVRGIRHMRADYSIVWEGSGAIAEIFLDGKPLSGRRLGLREGSHEVRVSLGERNAG
jgi:hypothetical protein